MSAIVYNRAKNNITISDLRVMLVKGYTPDADHATLAAIVGSDGCDECAFTNYARKALTDEAFSVDNVNDRGKLDATDPATWEDAGGTVDETVSHAIVYEHVDGTDANDLPVSCHSVGKTTNGGDLTVQFSADGILYTS